MRPTRWRDLVLVALVAGIVAWLGSYGVYRRLPELPRTTALTLFLLAVAEGYLAPSVRARLAGRPRTKPILPIVVARFAAMAKASSSLGALSTGVWAGVAGYVLMHRDDFPRSASDDLVTCALSALTSVLLITAALWLEHSCRVPPPRDAELDQAEPAA